MNTLARRISMKRLALYSLVPVALVAVLLGARGAGMCPSKVSAGDESACSASGASASSHTAVTDAKGHRDPLMAMVCERSCAAKAPYREEMVMAQPNAHVGALTRCPVSGVVFTVTGESPDLVYHGAHYRLCCGGCEKKFRANPARFVS
jgi:hypothetical protein